MLNRYNKTGSQNWIDKVKPVDSLHTLTLSLTHEIINIQISINGSLILSYTHIQIKYIIDLKPQCSANYL